jgi:3'-phosphoadenosine 5'-phosphosulfate sulfotransferase (PAPS reductase)/FAD synthetase
MEWPMTKELAAKQAEHFGLQIEYSQRRTKEGKSETILDYARRRKKWPSNKQRWCTSDFKRGPGATVITRIHKDAKFYGLVTDVQIFNVLYVFGFRADESPARRKKVVLKRNINLSTKKRFVDEYSPILDWNVDRVWKTIHSNNLPYHKAYDLGMPRLSCVFCIFSPFDALVIAGKSNPELLDEYIATEDAIGHTFKKDFSLHEVRNAISNGYTPKQISDWVM